jgi:hypothetical protein
LGGGHGRSPLKVKTTARGQIKFAVLGVGAEGGADRGTGLTVRAQVRYVQVENGDLPSGIVAGTVKATRVVEGRVVGAEIDEIGRRPLGRVRTVACAHASAPLLPPDCERLASPA